MKHIFTLFLVFLSFIASALDPNHFVITRITAPYFIVDGNAPSTVNAAYVGFEVKNTSAVTYTGLRFTITSIGTSVAGQNYAVVSPASGVINAGTLAPGESKVCYYYVSYPASVTPQATFNVQLNDQTANAKTQSFIIRNRSCISANAGGTATQTFTNQDIVGGIILDDVTYVVGNVQNGDENDFQVAVSPQYDPTKMTLLSTHITASSIPGINAGATDSLYFVSGNGTNGATVTVRWTFRITGYNFTNYLLPCAGATSGATNYKYALNTNLGAGTPVTVSSNANPLTITKTSDKNMYKTNVTALFTVTITNPGAFGVTIDKITDELPAGFVFQAFHATSQVTDANSTAVPVNGATGTINFEGGVNNSYYVPAGGSVVLAYTATSPGATALNLTTTVRDFIGTTQVGSAQHTVGVSATVPVNISNFKGMLVNGHAKLEWAASREVNVSAFQVERSTNNDQYTAIASVNATGATSYTYTDSVANAGANYYRLKAMDHDGQFAYSPIVRLEKRTGSLFVKNLYPNPFTSSISIHAHADKAGELELVILNASGAVLKQFTRTVKRGDNAIVLSGLENLLAGTYTLQAIGNNEKRQFTLVKR